MKNQNYWNELSEFYKIFGDATRLKILDALLDGEKSVTEITEKVEISQSAASHQLRTLRKSTLVTSEKKGQNVYYKIADEHIQIILEYGCIHLEERISKWK